MLSSKWDICIRLFSLSSGIIVAEGWKDKGLEVVDSYHKTVFSKYGSVHI